MIRDRFPVRITPSFVRLPVKKQISAALALAALIALAACGSAPTASETASPGAWQANSAPADTTGRVPNMMGSGN